MKVFIAGGTTGIGFATALRYLREGCEVGICGRDLSKVQNADEYPSLKMYQLDICDKESLQNAVHEFSNGNLEIMIVSAGSYADDSLHEISYEEATNMLRVNIVGTVNALEVARETMKSTNGGHIAIVSSVSGLLNYPNATTYSRTKTAIISIANAYRRALSNFGITISVITSGYVSTDKLKELNNGDLSKKPFVVSPSYAADQIFEGIKEKKELIAFPKQMKRLIDFISCLPSWMISLVMYRKAKWYQKK